MYAKEFAVLPRVLSWDEEKTGRPAPEDPRFPNHNTDAGLYSWRWTLAYLHEPKTAAAAVGSPAWAAVEEERMFEEAREQAQQADDVNEWL